MSQSVGALALYALIAAVTLHAAPAFPAWAYPVNPPGAAPVTDDGTLIQVPDSRVALTRTQISTGSGPVADWHPEDHPPMPAILVRAAEPKGFACAYCHLPSGAGRPENASLAGLPAAYIKQEVLAFREGTRPGSEPARGPQTAMISVAQAVSDADLDAAAAYYAALKPVSFLKVIESPSVPKTTVAGWMLVQASGGGSEPIGNRVIEMAEDFTRFEHRDARATFIVYAPVGSIARGAELVATGAGDPALKCEVCHGPGLHGLANVPRLPGRSPSYLMRQLYDIRNGKRTGGASVLMKPVVARLSDEDMVAIVAYLASLAP